MVKVDAKAADERIEAFSAEDFDEGSVFPVPFPAPEGFTQKHMDIIVTDSPILDPRIGELKMDTVFVFMMNLAHYLGVKGITETLVARFTRFASSKEMHAIDAVMKSFDVTREDMTAVLSDNGAYFELFSGVKRDELAAGALMSREENAQSFFRLLGANSENPGLIKPPPEALDGVFDTERGVYTESGVLGMEREQGLLVHGIDSAMALLPNGGAIRGFIERCRADGWWSAEMDREMASRTLMPLLDENVARRVELIFTVARYKQRTELFGAKTAVRDLRRRIAEKAERLGGLAHAVAVAKYVFSQGDAQIRELRAFSSLPAHTLATYRLNMEVYEETPGVTQYPLVTGERHKTINYCKIWTSVGRHMPLLQKKWNDLIDERRLITKLEGALATATMSLKKFQKEEEEEKARVEAIQSRLARMELAMTDLLRAGYTKESAVPGQCRTVALHDVIFPIVTADMQARLLLVAVFKAMDGRGMRLPYDTMTEVLKGVRVGGFKGVPLVDVKCTKPRCNHPKCNERNPNAAKQMHLVRASDNQIVTVNSSPVVWRDEVNNTRKMIAYAEWNAGVHGAADLYGGMTNLRVEARCGYHAGGSRGGFSGEGSNAIGYWQTAPKLLDEERASVALSLGYRLKRKAEAAHEWRNAEDERRGKSPRADEPTDIAMEDGMEEATREGDDL